MAEEIAISEFEARSVVEVAAETKLWAVPKALAEGFSVARSSIEDAGGEVVDMPCARFLEIDWASFGSKGALAQILEFIAGRQKLCAGRFCARPVQIAGPAVCTEIPAGRYVTTIHRGAYHRVGNTYRRIVEWAAAEGIGLADSSLEHYIDDPETMPMADVRTSIRIACRSPIG